LPESFEVFDGLVDCTSDKLSVFLERVKVFRSSTFVVLNVESLDGKLLENLLSFLSNPGIAQDGICLHLLQQEGSMLHTAPWVRGVRWELDDYHNDHNAGWKNLILDGIHMNEVSVVWSPQSGAGKTRYIQEKFGEGVRRDRNGESAKVTIHERTSVKSLTQALATKFSQSTGTKSVHLNLTSLSAGAGEQSSRWADCLNHFFFSLLVLRFVRDSDSARSFHLGESKWRIYIEFPNSDGFDSTRESVVGWLQKHVPAVLLCANLVAPPTHLIIDEETRRVCTYLRAYDDGTIDRKFETPQHRRIVLVLDKSGSMEINLGNSSALSVATDNALGIFDTHVGVGDVSW